jgi:hypothetical protein
MTKGDGLEQATTPAAWMTVAVKSGSRWREHEFYLSIFDLFSYAIPGSLYLAFLHTYRTDLAGPISNLRRNLMSLSLLSALPWRAIFSVT